MDMKTLSWVLIIGGAILNFYGTACFNNDQYQKEYGVDVICDVLTTMPVIVGIAILMAIK